MSINSKIQWTNATWNPLTGCTKISPGCKNCYAEKMAERLQAMGSSKYKNGFKLTLQPDALTEPYKWKKPRLVFVNSMSDLFHDNVPLEYIKEVFKVMNNCSQHQFQVLTKRANRLLHFAPDLNWTKNIWIGVSVENQDYVYRIDYLREVSAHIRFISFEPLIGPIIKPNLENISWAICGGESGANTRPMQVEWVRAIRDACIKENIQFFFKQWGGRNKKLAGRILDGKEWNEFPNF